MNTKEIEEGISQATPKEICDEARKHYLKLSDDASDWMSTIPHALDIYEEYLAVKMPEEKKIGMIGYNGDDIPDFTTEQKEAIYFNQALHLCKLAVMKGVPSVEEMSQVTIQLVEDNFPKHQCKERGKAIVLHAQMLIAIHKLILERLGVKEER